MFELRLLKKIFFFLSSPPPTGAGGVKITLLSAGNASLLGLEFFLATPEVFKKAIDVISVELFLTFNS